jgi:hypothetical protein
MTMHNEMKSGDVTSARSVLDCGSPLPLSLPQASHPLSKSARVQAHSKTWRLCPIYFCFLLSAFCFRAWGQYSIDWFTIDGGGVTSTNGQYSLSGTIGQPDAGAMNGGNYSLTGGFWSLNAVVQTPGAPLLSIVVTGPNTVIVSWPSSSSGFVLQTNSNLATANWNNYDGTVGDNGTVKSVTNSPPAGSLFFRLKK